MRNFSPLLIYRLYNIGAYLEVPRSFVYVRYNIQRYGHSTTHRCLSAGGAVAGGGGGRARYRAITIGGGGLG